MDREQPGINGGLSKKSRFEGGASERERKFLLVDFAVDAGVE